MPISMNALLEKTERITGEFHGDTYTVEFWPHKITDAVWAKLREFRQSEGFGPLNEVLAYLIADWDLVHDASRPKDDPGNRLPITIAWMEQLPTPLKMDISGQIIDAATIDPKSSNENSPNTLSPTASSAAVPNGTLSSAPPNISELHPGRLLGPITQSDTPPGTTGLS